MAYPYREKPTETQPEKQPEPQQKPSEIAELRKEIVELKALVEKLAENASERERLNANLEEWTDNIGTHLAKEVVGAVTPEVQKQRSELDKIDININALLKKVKSLFRFSRFKEVLFWISVLCNIGIAGYLIYILLLAKGVIS